jgi:cytochrome P450
MPPGSHWFGGHIAMIRGDFTLNLKRLTPMPTDKQAFGLQIYLTDWRDARTILRSEYQTRLMPLSEKYLNMFIGPRNIGALQGREWKLHRAAIGRSFGAGTVEASKQVVADVTQTIIMSLKTRIQQSSASSTPLVLDIAPLVKMIAVDVFGKTAFSTDLHICESLESSPIAEAFDYLSKDLTSRLRSPFLPTNYFYSLPTRANRQHPHVRTLLRAVLADKIQERRQCGDDPKDDPTANKHDVLSELLSTVKGEHYSTSDNDLQDTLMALLYAGYDTTGITLAYALYQISQHLEVEEFILAEINAADSLDNPDQLQYVQGVLYETLRLFPPGTAVARFFSKALAASRRFCRPCQSPSHCSHLVDSA